MAGAGYKLFNTGDVLTAAQVNTYLMEQTIMVFANTTARDTALSGVLAQGMQCFLKDTNTMQYYSGSAWVTLSTGGDITSVTAGTGLTGGGTSGDVTLSLSTPVSATNGGTAQTSYATGDLLYASSTNTLTKRAIGTTGQVLTVASGVPTWSTPASSGALTQITATSTANSGGTVTTSGGAVTASGVNSVSLNGIFSSTYQNYVIVIDNIKGNTVDNFALRFRNGGTDNTGATNYKYAILYGTDAGTAGSAGSAGASYAFAFEVTSVTDCSLGAVINVWNPFNSATITSFASTHRRDGGSGLTTGRTVATGSFDGITFTDAGLGRTFSGTIRVYGYSN